MVRIRQNITVWMMVILSMIMLLCTPCYAKGKETNTKAKTKSSMASLTKEEKKYVKDHPEISIAIDTSWVPYGFLQKDNTCGGIIPNAMKIVANSVGWKVKFVPRDTYAGAIEACKSGKTMLVSGIANDERMAAKNQVNITNPYIQIGYSAVTKVKIPDLYNDGANYKAAICVGTYAKMAMQKQMPSYQFVDYHNNQECMDAVVDGKADIALVANYSVGYFDNYRKYSSLQTIQINDFQWGLCFGVNKDCDPMVTQILNKGIAAMSEGDLNQAIYAGATEATELSHTFVNTVMENPIVAAVFSAVAVLTVAIIIFLIYSRIKTQKSYIVEMELRKEAEEANAAKGLFLSRVSHDMRTPMNGILGLTDLSEDTEDAKVLHENMRQIKSEGKYLLNLINDTLDIQKINAGKMELHPVVIRCETFINDLMPMVKMQAKEHGIDFKFINMNTKLDHYVYVDGMRLQQIFLNLISNAIKFTEPGGKVTVTFEHVKEDEAGRHSIITISDTGVGMSEEFVKNNLFKPFSQEFNDTTSKYTGTGLGLSIVKTILDTMGGSIQVDSKMNEGTTVTVCLVMPIANESQIANVKSEPDQAIDEKILEGKQILLAEDHPLNAKIAINLLEKKGCIITCKEDGKKVVEEYKNSKPFFYDAILMDIRMPEMDGLEATRTIRSLDREDAKIVPIIAMTANALAEDAKNCFKAGMDAHVGKPIDPNLLYQTLKNHIRK